MAIHSLEFFFVQCEYCGNDELQCDATDNDIRCEEEAAEHAAGCGYEENEQWGWLCPRCVKNLAEEADEGGEG